MNALIPTIWAAGGLLLFLAAANFFLPKKLNYAENLPKLTPILRQIFVSHPEGAARVICRHDDNDFPAHEIFPGRATTTNW